MLVFVYDKTIEGLMTAVFDAYSRRAFPERIVGQGEPHPMFTTEVYEVVTDRQCSDRVWRGLKKKVPGSVLNMLTHVWLSEEPGSDELIFRYIRKVFDSGEYAYTDFSDPDVQKAQKIAQVVSKERLYIIQFTRFQKAGDDTFFAAVAPRCNALPLSLNYFTDRFADQKWIVYDIKRRYGYFYDLQTVTEINLLDEDNFTDGKLDERLMAEDEKLFQSLWRSYFKAMTIKERINPKLHRQNMPRRFWKYLPEKYEE